MSHNPAPSNARLDRRFSTLRGHRILALEGQDAAFPAVLHFNVFAILLFGDKIGVNDAGSFDALGLENFQIDCDGLPMIVEDLVGVVTVDER